MRTLAAATTANIASKETTMSETLVEVTRDILTGNKNVLVAVWGET